MNSNLLIAFCLSFCIVSLCDAHDYKSKGKHGAGAPHVVACQGKTEGTKCTFKCAGGKEKTATCMKTPHGLACGSQTAKSKGKHHGKKEGYHAKHGALDQKDQMTKTAHGH